MVPSQDRTARRHLDGGNATPVQDDEPVTVSGLKDTGVLRKRGDDVPDDLVDVLRVGFLVGDVHVFASGEPDAQHDLRHESGLYGVPPRELPCSVAPASDRSQPGDCPGDRTLVVVEVPLPSHARDRVVVDVGQGLSVRGMRQGILAALEGRPHDLVIDRRGVDHLSDQGLALLSGVKARQRSGQQALTLVCGLDSATEQAMSRNEMKRSFTTVTELDLLSSA